MLSVVIPTLDAAKTLPACLTALYEPAIAGAVRQVVVSDGGSSDTTLAVAENAGCDILRGDRGRGRQLAAGAEAARADWLLFLHADTVLEEGWDDEAVRFANRHGPGAAAAFRFALDDDGWRPALLERAVALRSRLLALPYGDQALLISRRLYDRIGGYGDMPIMEDVDIVRRIGRPNLHHLSSRAVTSAARYRDGYAARVLRNARCLTLYRLGVPPAKIARVYE
ncbi:MAG: TIGR04283 family arsenosugar biosynthesis glycosyltransferase [Flavobacteriaceae bacterium]